MVAFRMEKAVPELRNWTLPKWAQNPFSRPCSLFKQGALLIEKKCLFYTFRVAHLGIHGMLRWNDTLCSHSSHFAPQWLLILYCPVDCLHYYIHTYSVARWWLEDVCVFRRLLCNSDGHRRRDDSIFPCLHIARAYQQHHTCVPGWAAPGHSKACIPLRRCCYRVVLQHCGCRTPQQQEVKA